MKPRPSLLRHAVVAALLLGMGVWASAEEGGTTHDTVAEALAAASEDSRGVMVLFKAWYCPHCQRLEREVLRHPDFLAHVRERLHLVVYEVARRGDLTEAQRRELDALMRERLVRFTPTVVLFSPEGKALWQSDELDGIDAADFIELLEKAAESINPEPAPRP